jgi:hypothetical protein
VTARTAINAQKTSEEELIAAGLMLPSKFDNRARFTLALDAMLAAKEQK